MRTNVFFVLGCFVIDGILMTLFPSSFLMRSQIFIPSIGFCAMVLTIRKFDFINACLFACCFGMFYDFFYAQTFLTYAIIYTVIAMIVCVWSKHMTDTLIELLILSISTLFVKELVVYFLMYLQGLTQMSLQNWFVEREFNTLIINSLLLCIIVFLTRIKDDYLKIKESRIRKEERISWMNVSSRH